MLKFLNLNDYIMQTNENFVLDEHDNLTPYGKKLILRCVLWGLLAIVVLCTGCSGFFTVKSTER